MCKTLLSPLIVVGLICIPIVISVCPVGWEEYMDNCYLFNHKDAKRWINAHAFCHLFESRLVEIYDAETDLWLKNRARQIKAGSWFIGLIDVEVEDDWVWADSRLKLNTTYLYKGWRPGDPNHGTGMNCACLETGSGWWDERCDAQRPYICQKSNKRNTNNGRRLRGNSRNPRRNPQRPRRVNQMTDTVLANNGQFVQRNIWGNLI